MTFPRYSVDRVGDMEWAIFDGEKKGTPTVYLLYVVETVGMYNYQVVLTSYNAVESAQFTLPVLSVEIYSTHFYSIPEGMETMIHNIFLVLFRADVENPVELAHAFGGTVYSKPIQQAKMLSAH